MRTDEQHFWLSLGVQICKSIIVQNANANCKSVIVICEWVDARHYDAICITPWCRSYEQNYMWKDLYVEFIWRNMMPRNVSQLKISCRIFGQGGGRGMTATDFLMHCIATWMQQYEIHYEARKMQIQFDNAAHTWCTQSALLFVQVQIMAENWTDELQCRARARFGGEGKNETVSGKGDDGAGSGGEQSRARLWTYILFSQGLPSPLSIISNPPIRYFTAACTFWGANCLLNDYFTASWAVWKHLETTPYL